MAYVIGSFNLYKYSMMSTDEFHKNLDRIADIIRDQKFDVVALQEIMVEPSFLERLTKRIGLTWKCFVCHSEGLSHYHAESYAYIWNDSKLQLIGTPRIYEANGMKSKLVRPPMEARFSPCNLIGGLFFELRLINTHIAFGAPKGKEMSDIDYRREEFNILTDEVYPSIDDKRYGDFKPAYTILMGDYNLCITGSIKIKGHAIKGMHYDQLCKNGHILTTVQCQPTTLKQVKKSDQTEAQSDNDAETADAEESKRTGDYYSQDFDHFTYDKDRFKGVGLSSPERVDALRKYYDNDLALYRKEISDHVPIKIVLDFNSPFIDVEEEEIDD